MGNNNYKKIIILLSVLAVGIITITVILALKDDGGYKPKGGKQNPTASAVPDAPQPGTLMMLTGIDLDSSAIYAVELESGEEHAYIFTGGSDIRTKSNRVISAAMLKKGNIARIQADDEGKIKTLIGSDEVWTYKNNSNLRIYPETGRIDMGSNTYRFGSAMKVLNDGEFVSVDSLEMDGTDMVDIYGIDNFIYLIKVVSGHGYLTLTNNEDFLGGTIYYGIGKSADVTENLKVMLSEGEHEITVENNGCTATAVIKISNNEETAFDLEGYGPEPVEYGEVSFKIIPDGSLLYIDGVRTNYNEPVSLTLGFHEIEAELGGYTGYKGSITVGTEGLSKSIALSPAPVQVSDDILYDDPDDEDFFEDPEDDNEGSDTATDNWSSNVGYTDIPDNTSNGPDDEDIEVVDGDRPSGGSSNNSGKTNNDGSGNITVTGDNGDVDDENGTYGEMTIYCSENTQIYINDAYKGRITNGSLTIPKPVGTIELKLVKEGYVTKKYTLTMDTEEENSIFRFPEMTPEN